VTPFLRWAGGKRWLAPHLAPLITERLSTSYHEPFVGAGAIYFYLRPKNAVLTDINNDLINTYKIISKRTNQVLDALRAIPVDSENFYRIRGSSPRDSLMRAVRFIYLNRTCYGGIHRTNQRGEYNTPYGGGSRTPEPLWRDGILSAAASMLRPKTVRIFTSDFERPIDSATEGDVIYCDPVYATRNREKFDRYNPRLFGWEDQIRLRNAVYRANKRGVLVVMSNTYSAEVRSLYPSAFRIALERQKFVNGRTKSSGSDLEYLIVLDPTERRKDWESLGRIERRSNGARRLSQDAPIASKSRDSAA
jgi:DNA adenine methylase